MANDINHDPIRIDVWTGDIVLAKPGTPFYINRIVFLSADIGDDFFLHTAEVTNGGGVKQYAVTTLVDAARWQSEDVDFTFENGVYIDVSQCTGYGAGDVVLIYQ